MPYVRFANSAGAPGIIDPIIARQKVKGGSYGVQSWQQKQNLRHQENSDQENRS
jgi:hypothetical protein